MLPTKEKKIIIEKIWNNWYSITVMGKRNYNKLIDVLGKPATYYYKSIKQYPDECEIWSFVANNKQISNVKSLLA